MGMKKLIWIVGGMASGKSTLRDALIEEFKTKTPVLVSDEYYEYADAGRVASVGNCLKPNACNGLDSSFGRLKKDGAIATARRCVERHDIVLVEGSQTSAQWILPLCEICLDNNCEFILVHLDIRLWENFQRLRKRLLEAGKTEADITDDKLKSVAAKNSQARFITEQCLKTEFVKVIQIDTEGLTQEEVLDEVLQEI